MQLTDFAARTDVGKLREHNEDNYVVIPEAGLLAVADGMGGLEHGEVASATAVSIFRSAQAALQPIVEVVDASPARGPRSQLAYALEQLSNLASLRIQQVTGGASSGTTLVVGCVAGGHLVLANTGDSRAYLLRGEALRCITVDHTVAASRLRDGAISQEEHDASPYQHMLTQALGTQGEVNPDVFDEPLAAGDLLLFCSDGLTGPVREPHIAHLLLANPDLDAAAEALIVAANANGGPDNITVLLYRVEDGPSAEELEQERQSLQGAAAMRFLSDLDHRIVRHFLDRRAVEEGEAFNLTDGVYFLVDGRAREGEVERDAGAIVGLKGFAGEDESQPDVVAVTDCRALVLSPAAYDALEVRRPQVAARLMHGLLSLAFED